MTVRSRTLGGPFPVAAGNTLALGPLSGRTWVVRTVVLCNDRAAAVPFVIGVDGFTEPALIVNGLTVPANGRRVFEEWWAVGYPHVLWFKNNHATHPITITVFGANLVGVDV